MPEKHIHLKSTSNEDWPKRNTQIKNTESGYGFTQVGTNYHV